MSGEAIQAVALPLVIVLATGGLFLVGLHRRNGGQPPWFEIGAFYVIVVLLYTVLPLLTFAMREVIGGLPTDDIRFSLSPFTSPEVRTIAWWHIVHLACFAASYMLARGKVGSERKLSLNPGAATVQVLVAYLILSQAVLFLVGLYYNLSFETYQESYVIERELPLTPRYIAAHATLMSTTLKLLLLIAAFSNWRQYRWFIIAFLVYAVCNSFLLLHSRTEMAMLLIASGILYHRCVRRFNVAEVAVWGSASLLVLLLFGALRTEGSLNPEELRFAITTSGGEFECAMANAIDLQRKRDAGLLEKLSFHDVYLSPLTLIIPQPFLPFEKFNFSTWYMTTFFLDSYEQGGGMAFGAIPEAIAGAGWPDLVWRAVALGLVFAFVHRYYIRHSGSYWVDAFYLWLLLFSYQTFRDTSFSLIYLSIHRFLLLWVVVRLVTRVAGSRPGFQKRMAWSEGRISP
jgi:hypothetical protein